MAISPPPRRARPLLLNKADALNYAAERLEQMAADLAMAKMLVDLVGDRLPPDETDAAEALSALQAETREPQLQEAAMRDAAKAIRELAMEERLMAARAQAGQHIRPGGQS